jgi:hypothetical protein
MPQEVFMKQLVIGLATIISLSGCANTPYRQGKLVVEPFATNAYITNNPNQIKDDFVDRLAGSLERSIEKQISRNSVMTLGKSCTDSDFELTGRFEKVDFSAGVQLGFTSVKSNQEFSVGVTAELKDCKTGKVLSYIETNKGGDDLTQLIDTLAGKVISRISRHEAKSVTY